MKFSTREEIDLSQERVFGYLTDFAGIERLAMRRGAQVERLVEGGAHGEGAQWKIGFRARGRQREMQVTLAEVVPSDWIHAQGTLKGLASDLEITLAPLAPYRCRMQLSLDLRPSSMPARLLLQSVKLAKGSMTTRFKTRVADFARTLEARAREEDAQGASAEGRPGV